MLYRERGSCLVGAIFPAFTEGSNEVKCDATSAQSSLDL